MLPVKTGAIVSEIEPGGPAAAAGLRPGDRVIAVDGIHPRDIIDWQLLTTEPAIEIEYERDDLHARALLESDDFGRLGVSFESSVFDRLRTCSNHCAFCFVDQLPPKCRETMRIKDDDFRLSFLYGNFVTLTNLTDSDLERIVADRLSPLYVSLHTLDPGLRRRLLAPPARDRALERLAALLDAGTEIHIQIVVCPGLNDGDELTATLDGLRDRFPGTTSVGLVPVGLTGHRQGLPALRPFSAGEARALIEEVEARQDRYRAQEGVAWVYAADEFYLMSGLEVPPASGYDNFPQIENGIGLSRVFLDELTKECQSRDLPSRSERTVDIVTSRLGSAILRLAAEKIEKTLGVRLRVIEAANVWLGGAVSVAPLLSGSDIEVALRAAGAAGPVLFPAHCLNADGLFLDNLTPAEIEKRIGLELVAVVPTGRGLMEAVLSAGRQDG